MHLKYSCIERVGRRDDQADIARISQQILATNFSNNDYWTLSAEDYCSIFLGILKECCPEESQNLHGLKMMVEAYIADEKSLNHLIVKSKSPELISSFKAMAATPEKTRLSTLATLKSTFSRISSRSWSVRDCLSK